MVNEIIGQDKTVNMLDSMVESNNLPRFIAISGQKGSGRKTIVRHLAKKMNASIFEPEDGKITVDYIRNIIDQAYKQTSPTVYLIPNADYLNQSSANALLKITEEPPNNAYFMVTTDDSRSVLPATLRSRCVTYRLDKYPKHLLVEYAKSLGVEVSERNDQLFRICATPGDIKNFVAEGVQYQSLEDFTNKVIDNVGKVSGANVFKIDESIAFKDEDKGYNLQTFWVMFSNLSMQRTRTEVGTKRNLYFSYIRITNEYRQKLLITGINKRSLFDLWLIEIRDIYSKYN